MTFNSYIFIFLYLPIFLLGLYALQSLMKNKNSADLIIKLWIIVMSALFFIGFGFRSVCIFGISISVNALFASYIPSKKKVFIPAVIFNVVILCFFKYNSLLTMPIAISFYTFQQIAYLSELKKGTIEEFRLIDYLSYITFFPKILQGPLSDYKNIIGQIGSLKEKRVNSIDIMDGLYLFTLGLVKKVLLSDVLGAGVIYGYTNLSTLTAMDAVIVAVSYSFQLYFDFAGYCDMAEGVCRMMGIDLQINFNAPYIAKNISEFWDRWHITLTGFFTKYLYIPLGGSRKGKVRTYINILIIFFISGIWHGTGFTFIIWGMMHGILMVLTRMYLESSKDKVKEPQGNATVLKMIQAVKVFFTFLYVTVAWVFFRASTVSDAVMLIKKCFLGFGETGLRITINLAECFQLDELWYVFKVTPIPSWNKSGYLCMWIILAISAVLIFRGKTARNMSDEFAKYLRSESLVSSKRYVLSVVFVSILFVWCVLSFGNVSTFLYVNF